MKKILKTAAACLLFAGGISSCSLDERNPSTVDLEIAYKYKDSYESLVNYCYDALYYFYGKVDGIGAMEMGTDLWSNYDTGETGFILYNSDMNTTLTTLKTIWQGFYATVNYCNTAIYYADLVEDYQEDEKNAKVAEAYFLRAWAYWHLVEQFGGVTLTTLPSNVTGMINAPERSTEEEIYDLILSDLQFAIDHLPVSQGQERGRVDKKAAYAMMAKAALQRIRLGDEATYAKMALDAAEHLINNAAAYGVGLYESDETQSGFEKLWDGNNNKANLEFVFLEAVDYSNSFDNPEGTNRGRTRQYYLMDLNGNNSDWGTLVSDAWLGRANSNYFKPTQYLLTEIFEPVADPADTRFKTSFWTEYYNASWVEKTISAEMCETYNKNPNLAGRVILNTAGTHTETNYLGQYNWMGRTINAFGVTNMVDEDGDGWLDGLSIFTPNWEVSAEDKYNLPFWIVTPSDMFDANGKWVDVNDDKPLDSKIRRVFPSLKKFSAYEMVYDYQYWMGDFPIIRMGDVYLMAAEAALRYNGDQAKALEYVNTLRRRCAVTSRQAEMEVTQAEMNLDFILAERARELVGEQVRWYDLKRMGKLTNEYLARTNPNIEYFDENKHTLRPIPQTFLDAISNPKEYGSNGYLE
ncbi:MAG: RagB/SusD family nutrient uptake outer membrane protein [Rikenellaceae bacterium]|nr:RagB/SusD family nutrient uptake outer membrane protein [Rikenellaceae bacterium]